MNRRRIILTAFAAIVAATVTTTALAASGGPNPKTMVLQKSDFPAGARLTDKFGGTYDETDEWAVSWNYKIGAKQFNISMEVVVLSPDLAAIYSDLHQLPPVCGQLLPPGNRQIVLPKYGDEQMAEFGHESFVLDADGGQLRCRVVASETRGELSVRKGRVLWFMQVTRRDGVLTKAEAIAQLKRYAPKVMERVGSGLDAHPEGVTGEPTPCEVTDPCS